MSSSPACHTGGQGGGSLSSRFGGAVGSKENRPRPVPLFSSVFLIGSYSGPRTSRYGTSPQWCCPPTPQSGPTLALLGFLTLPQRAGTTKGSMPCSWGTMQDRAMFLGPSSLQRWTEGASPPQAPSLVAYRPPLLRASASSPCGDSELTVTLKNK